YAQQGYVFSEPFVIRKEGGDPQVLMVSDLGYNPYTSMLVTSDNFADNNADIVRRMVAASIRGWEKYITQPEETNAYIHRLNPEMDLDILEYGAEKMRPLVTGGDAQKYGIGTMSLARWQKLAEQLVETDQLSPQDVHVEAAFTTRF